MDDNFHVNTDAYGPNVKTTSRPKTRCAERAWFIANTHDGSRFDSGIAGLNGMNLNTAIANTAASAAVKTTVLAKLFPAIFRSISHL
jgi:hypothetical protein